MSITVTLNNLIPTIGVEVKTSGKTTATVAPISTAPPAQVSSLAHLSQIQDVDTSDANNTEVLVYDEVLGKYVVKQIPVVQGGTF